MKASIIFIALTTLLFCSCGSNNKKVDITGSYVTHFKNEFTITDDTLVVSQYDLKNNLYKIESRSAYNKIRNGVVQTKQFATDSHIATWKSDGQVFQEIDLGRQMHFIADKSLILIGHTEYHKIK